MWNMPKSVLRIVLAILIALAVTGFVMGIRSAPEPSTLPEEAGAGQALPAREFQPLNTDPPPPPPPPAPEEKTEETPPAKTEPEKAPAPAEKTPPVVSPPPAPATPPDDTVGDLIDGLTPPPDQPPF